MSVLVLTSRLLGPHRAFSSCSPQESRLYNSHASPNKNISRFTEDPHFQLEVKDAVHRLSEVGYGSLHDPDGPFTEVETGPDRKPPRGYQDDGSVILMCSPDPFADDPKREMARLPWNSLAHKIACWRGKTEGSCGHCHDNM